MWSLLKSAQKWDNQRNHQTRNNHPFLIPPPKPKMNGAGSTYTGMMIWWYPFGWGESESSAREVLSESRRVSDRTIQLGGMRKADHSGSLNLMASSPPRTHCASFSRSLSFNSRPTTTSWHPARRISSESDFSNSRPLPQSPYRNSLNFSRMPGSRSESCLRRHGQ